MGFRGDAVDVDLSAIVEMPTRMRHLRRRRSALRQSQNRSPSDETRRMMNLASRSFSHGNGRVFDLPPTLVPSSAQVPCRWPRVICSVPDECRVGGGPSTDDLPAHDAEPMTYREAPGIHSTYLLTAGLISLRETCFEGG